MVTFQVCLVVNLPSETVTVMSAVPLVSGAVQETVLLATPEVHLPAVLLQEYDTRVAIDLSRRL